MRFAWLTCMAGCILLGACKKNGTSPVTKITISERSFDRLQLEETYTFDAASIILLSKTLDDYVSYAPAVRHIDYTFFNTGSRRDSVHMKIADPSITTEMGQRYLYGPSGGLQLILISNKNTITNRFEITDSIYCFTDASNRLVLTKKYNTFFFRYLADSTVYSYDGAGNMNLQTGYQSVISGGTANLVLGYRFEKQFDNQAAAIYPQPLFLDYFSNNDFRSVNNQVRDKKTFYSTPLQVFEYTESYTYNSDGKPSKSVRNAVGVSAAPVNREFLYY